MQMLSVFITSGLRRAGNFQLPSAVMVRECHGELKTGVFYIDTNAKWSTGAPFIFIDMRSFASFR